MPTCHHDDCPNDATLHIWVRPPRHNHRGVLTCPDHVGEPGELLSIHAATDVCAQPGSLWLVDNRGANECTPADHGHGHGYEAVL